MKHKSLVVFLLAAFSGIIFPLSVHAATESEVSISKGVSIGPVDVSNMTMKEARSALKEYITKFAGNQVTITIDGEENQKTAFELGYRWQNQEVLTQAVGIGKTGNVIKRFKDKEDLSKKKKVLDLNLNWNDTLLTKGLDEMLSPYEKEAEEPRLNYSSSGFSVKEGSQGESVDLEATIQEIKNLTGSDWDGSAISLVATTKVTEPKHTAEELSCVSDKLGSYTTYFSTYSSSYNRNKNIENGANILGDITLYPGESLNVLEELDPWTEDNGWYEAGTFENGQVSTGLGGGICQVTTTLYNALLLAELQIDTRYNHSMTITYAPLAMDAAVAEGSKNLVFTNNLDYPIYIESLYSSSGSITYNIYGKETRDKNRSIKYVSETIDTVEPTDNITVDSSKDASYREVVTKGYTGYTAKLWKYVYIDGVEQSKELVNTSKYIMTQNEVVVGEDSEKETKDSEQEETTKKSSKKKNKSDKDKESDSEENSEEETTLAEKSSEE